MLRKLRQHLRPYPRHQAGIERQPRFLLVEENRIPSQSQRALTQREEQVVACAAMGHSNKLIAYDLGISTGSVAVLLGRAARKLGVSGRVALVRAFRESYRP